MLQVFPDLSLHNLPQLLEAGLVATVNSDDPAYFGGYINENFVQLFAATGMGARQAYQLARNSLQASFASKARKAHWLEQLDACFVRHGMEEAITP
ncbi:Adenine deaminase [compost metagenome]